VLEPLLEPVPAPREHIAHCLAADFALALLELVPLGCHLGHAQHWPHNDTVVFAQPKGNLAMGLVHQIMDASSHPIGCPSHSPPLCLVVDKALAIIRLLLVDAQDQIIEMMTKFLQALDRSAPKFVDLALEIKRGHGFNGFVVCSFSCVAHHL